MVARSLQRKQLFLRHLHHLHDLPFEREPRVLVVHPHCGAPLADHVIMPQHVFDRNAVLAHQPSCQQRRVRHDRVLQPVAPRVIPAAHLDGDRVAVAAARVLLRINARRADRPCRILVADRLQPAVPVDKIVGRGPARGLKIFESRRGGVVAPGRVVQHKKLDGCAAALRVITRMRRRHAVSPRRSAASAPASRNKTR